MVADKKAYLFNTDILICPFKLVELYVAMIQGKYHGFDYLVELNQPIKG